MRYIVLVCSEDLGGILCPILLIYQEILLLQLLLNEFCFLKKLEFTLWRAEQPLQGMELLEKEEEKVEKHKGKLLRRNPKIKVSINSIFKTIQIISSRKTFFRQRISESSCLWKEIVDIDILITSKSDDRKIMQPTRITSGPPTKMRMEPVQPVQRIIYQNNILIEKT